LKERIAEKDEKDKQHQQQQQQQTKKPVHSVIVYIFSLVESELFWPTLQMLF